MTTLVEASAALIALSFLVLPVKIATMLETDPLGLQGSYPPIVKRFYIRAISEICLATSMIFALSLFTVLVGIVDRIQLFSVWSFPFLGLSLFFLARKAFYFYGYLFGHRTKLDDHYSGSSDRNRVNLRYIISDKEEMDSFEKLRSSKLWSWAGFLVVMVSLFVGVAYLILSLAELLERYRLFDFQWVARFYEVLRQKSFPLWLLLVTLGLASVFVDHTLDDRLISHWSHFQQEMYRYLERVHKRFNIAIATIRSEVLHVLGDPLFNAELVLREEVPTVDNLRLEKYGVGSVLREGLTVGGGLRMLMVELDYLADEERILYDRLTVDVLQELSSEFQPYRQRLEKLHIIGEVLKAIQSRREAFLRAPMGWLRRLCLRTTPRPRSRATWR